MHTINLVPARTSTGPCRLTDAEVLHIDRHSVCAQALIRHTLGFPAITISATMPHQVTATVELRPIDDQSLALIAAVARLSDFLFHPVARTAAEIASGELEQAEWLLEEWEDALGYPDPLQPPSLFYTTAGARPLADTFEHAYAWILMNLHVITAMAQVLEARGGRLDSRHIEQFAVGIEEPEEDHFAKSLITFIEQRATFDRADEIYLEVHEAFAAS